MSQILSRIYLQKYEYNYRRRVQIRESIPRYMSVCTVETIDCVISMRILQNRRLTLSKRAAHRRQGATQAIFCKPIQLYGIQCPPSPLCLGLLISKVSKANKISQNVRIPHLLGATQVAKLPRPRGGHCTQLKKKRKPIQPVSVAVFRVSPRAPSIWGSQV